MEHVNTLKTFDNLVASGVPEKQARAHVESLNSSFDHVATKQDLLLMESNLKYFFTWEIVIVVLTLITLPTLADRFSNILRKK